MGRPSDFTPEMTDKLCALLMEGISLRRACLMDGMPDKATVHRWLVRHADFRDNYARARELWADKVFDEILEIADEIKGDTKVEEHDGTKVERVDHENINRSRLRVDARKWIAARLAPKKYGERVDIDHHASFIDAEGKPVAGVVNFIRGPEPVPPPKAVGGARKPRD